MRGKNLSFLVISLLLLILIFFFVKFVDFTITGEVTTETVESANDVGNYSSIAIDSNDKVHISSRVDEGIGIALRYCNNTAGSWNCITLELGEGTSYGQYSSIAIDSNDKVHISHYYATGLDLRYCNNTAGSWSCVAVETTEDVGKYSSIAIDSNDKIHISHREFDSIVGLDSLRYCNNTAGTWSCAYAETNNPNNLGYYSSIAIDSNNKVHISHQDNTNTGLRYCNNTAGSWSCVAVEVTGSVDEFTSIAIDSNDKIHISHYNGEDLRYCNNTAGSWSCASADAGPGGGVGQYSSIAIDSNDKIHISYYDNVNADLKYCNNINGTFVCKKLADADANSLGTPNGRALAIKKGRLVDSISFSGEVHISWYNNTDLLYTTIDITHPTLQFENLTTVTGNFSQNYIEANVTASDDNLSTITIYLYNSTSLVQSNTSLTSPLFVNFTGLPDGTYYLNSTANDTEGNENSTETRTIVLDTTAPTISFSCDSELVNVGDLITCSCSGTDSGVGVNTTDYTTSPSTATVGGFSTSCTVTDYLDHNSTAIWNYQVDPAVSGGSGGGGGSSGTPTLQKTSLLVNIVPGEPISITAFEGTGVKEIIIEINKATPNIRIKVLKYDSKPTAVSVNLSGKIYRYLEINTENLNESNLERATVKFEVEKSWISDNSLNKEDISVFKFDNSSEKWNELETTFENESGEFYIYSVELDSFSFFAIGEKLSIVESIASEITESYDKASETLFGLIVWWILVAIFLTSIALVFLITINLIKKKTQEKLGENLNFQNRNIKI